MFFKLIILSALVACSLAGDYEYAAPPSAHQLNGDLSSKSNNNNNHDVKDNTYNIYPASEATQTYNKNNKKEDYSSYTTAQAPERDSTYDSYTPEPETYNNNNNNNNGYNYQQAEAQLFQQQTARKEEAKAQVYQQQSNEVFQQQPKQVFHQQKQLTGEDFYYAPAKYDYNYAVHDDFTGDIKSHTETRDGNSVKGSYSVVDPDGFQRIVTYTADETSGFNAVVNRVPYALPVKTVVTKTAATAVKTEAAIEPRDSYASAPKAGSHPDGPYA